MFYVCLFNILHLLLVLLSRLLSILLFGAPEICGFSDIWPRGWSHGYFYEYVWVTGPDLDILGYRHMFHQARAMGLNSGTHGTNSVCNKGRAPNVH